jgi:hypothetical protein
MNQRSPLQSRPTLASVECVALRSSSHAQRVKRPRPCDMEIKIALTLILFGILFFAIYFTAIPS